MENEVRTNEITFGTLLQVLKKCIILMIVAAIMVGSAVAIYVAYMVKPTYKATTSFWVKNYSSTNDFMTGSLTTATITIADSCVELASQDKLVRQAVQKHNLTAELGYANEDACVRAIQGYISARRQSTTTFMFYVTVETADPDATFKIINAIQSTMPAVLQELLWTSTPENTGETLQVVGPVSSTNDVVMVKSSPYTAFALAAFVTAIVIYGIFFVIEICDKRVSDEKALKIMFSEPVIASIPSEGSDINEIKKLKRAKEKHLLRNYDKRILTGASSKETKEAFNTLKTNLYFYVPKNTTPVLAVTSGYSGEGKSLTCANLAIAMSSASRKVLLVECDMRMPSFGKMLGVSDKMGLSELLAGIKSETSDVVVNSKYGRFDIITCGQIPPNPTELLSSERMRALIAEWKQTYDIVILDMPPICEVVDASVVSDVVDGYLMVVRSRYSDTTELSNAIGKIKMVNGNMLGLVINDVNVGTSARKALNVGR